VRCIHFATPTREAERNIVQRMIERFGRLPEPEEIAAIARTEPTALSPTVLLRMTRDLEPPVADEGFIAVETVPFVRDAPAAESARLVVLPLDKLDAPRVIAQLAAHPREVTCLLQAWRPGIDEPERRRLHAFASEITDATGRVVEAAICAHPGGPPICWCRPPLPGLWLAFAHRHRLLGAELARESDSRARSSRRD